MTFYNIIFGILFLGACRELFLAGFHGKWKDFCVATTIALLVFNDTLFTSHEIESLKLTYSVSMKLIDLLDFLLLTAVIVILNPAGNFLGIAVKGRFYAHWREPIIWGLLSSYWLLGLAWNKLADVYSQGIGYREGVSFLLLVPFVFMTIVSFWPLTKLARFSRWSIILILLSYILFKAHAYY